MENADNYKFPQRIVCLTEESVETLYELGAQHLIAGISAFVKRPSEAKGNHPQVSFFTSSNYDKIEAQNPDLILGHSDIQKDIAKDLIERGHNVYIANHRSLEGILGYIRFIGNLAEKQEESIELIDSLLQNITNAQQFRKDLKRRPRVYFEEWDDPMISGIQWVSELIELCGGEDINKNLSQGVLAKERFTNSQAIIDLDPDIIIACWCGKKVKLEKIKERDGWSDIKAVKNNMVFEVQPEIFLQPGPAPLKDGIKILMEMFKNWEEVNV
jgi:iron complex transport system substrate-binding protein